MTTFDENGNVQSMYVPGPPITHSEEWKDGWRRALVAFVVEMQVVYDTTKGDPKTAEFLQRIAPRHLRSVEKKLAAIHPKEKKDAA